MDSVEEKNLTSTSFDFPPLFCLSSPSLPSFHLLDFPLSCLPLSCYDFMSLPCLHFLAFLPFPPHLSSQSCPSLQRFVFVYATFTFCTSYHLALRFLPLLCPSSLHLPVSFSFFVSLPPSLFSVRPLYIQPSVPIPSFCASLLPHSLPPSRIPFRSPTLRPSLPLFVPRPFSCSLSLSKRHARLLQGPCYRILDVTIYHAFILCIIP